ncbi:hypothetical protein [Methanocorpusculum labreanum]|nr:hypothetical protein [Methanocorpusculum labreanum]
MPKIEDSCQMVRQVFAGEFRQSKGDDGFDFGICQFVPFDESMERGDVG